jgi:integrase
VTIGSGSDGTGPVLRKPSGLELHSSRRWFENCLAEAKIEDFRWRDLRHTFATRLRRNQVPIEDIRILLGHDAKSITARYAHADMDSLHESVGTLMRKRVHPLFWSFLPARLSRKLQCNFFSCFGMRWWT